MKKHLIRVMLVICLIFIMFICVVSCKNRNFIIKFFVDGNEYYSTSIKEKLSMPRDPIKEGYTFDGWYFDDGVWQRPFAEKSFDEINDDVSVYAKFSPILLTVTFNSNGGSKVVSITDVSYGSTISKPTDPILENRVFLGWYSDNKFQNKWLFGSDKVTSNITLYAKWGVPSDLIYELNPDGESYSVVGVKTNDENIIIPSVYNNKLVTVIQGNGRGGAFFGLSITSVFIPDSILDIGSTAFAQCFYLTSINIPDSVINIGPFAFSACFSLEKITVDKENTKYHSDANCIIETDTKTLVVGCKKSIIPADGTVTKIKYAFAQSGISTVDIPKSVSEIGEGAFWVSGLTRITIPESVVSIADNAFECPTLVEICNKSQLNIVKGSDTFGKIAKYAKNVYTPTSGKSNIVDDDGLIFFCDETDTDLIAYESTETEVVLPQNFNGREYTISHMFVFNSNIKTLTIPDFLVDLSVFDVDPSVNTFSILTRETHPLYISKDGVIFNKNCTELIKVPKGIEELFILNNVVVISAGAFNGCSSLNSVYYQGTIKDWANVDIASNGNDCLSSATLYYYSETEPALNTDGTAYDGNYWHYGDNHEVVVWTYNKENN